MNEWTKNLRALNRGASKDIQEVLRVAQEAGGWSGRKLKKGHILLRHDGGGTASVPFTPSDHRAVKNLRAQIRRQGTR
jgi:hypothetical protein